MHSPRPHLRLIVVALIAAAALAAGASAATDRADSLLAPSGVCRGGDRVLESIAVQMQAMSCLVEYARAHAGLPPLRLSLRLDQAAALKIDADLRCGRLSHTPCGASFLTAFSASGYIEGGGAFIVGENLALGQGWRRSPRQVMSMWLHSPEHLRNLLSRRWRDFGLGFRAGVDLDGLRGATIWANEFGARRG